MNAHQSGLAAASLAVMAWEDRSHSHEIIGATPSMLSQIAVDAYLRTTQQEAVK